MPLLCRLVLLLQKPVTDMEKKKKKKKKEEGEEEENLESGKRRQNRMEAKRRIDWMRRSLVMSSRVGPICDTVIHTCNVWRGI